MTLLSSTSDPSISPLFTTTTDPEHPNDSFIATLPDSLQSEPSSSKRSFDRHYVSRPETEAKGDVIGNIIHIQSPNPRTAYIQAGSRKGKERAKDAETGPLGIELPWIGIQVKRLGKRGMSFEFGIVDTRGREGIIRVSSYKVRSLCSPLGLASSLL